MFSTALFIMGCRRVTSVLDQAHSNALHHDLTLVIVLDKVLLPVGISVLFFLGAVQRDPTPRHPPEEPLPPSLPLATS